MNRSIASTLASLAMIALPPTTLARNQPTVQNVWFQLVGATKVTLSAADVRGAHTVSFVQSSDHAVGTVLPGGTVVHSCAQPLSSKVGVTVDATGYTGAAFGVVVKVGATTPIGVSSAQKGVVQFQGNVALAQNSAHAVEVTVGTAPAAKPTLRFSLVLKCVVVGAPAVAAPSAPAVVSKPPVTVAKPLGPMPAQVTPPQAGKGPALPPSNVKLAMECRLTFPDNLVPVHLKQPIAEVRPLSAWVNPPATARITVTNNMNLALPNYPSFAVQYFKLPKSLWQPGGPHARVTLPTFAKLELAADLFTYSSMTCKATADAASDSIAGYPLTP